MSDPDLNNSPLGHLALSPDVRAKSQQLLTDIDRADSLQALLIASGRALGFCEALEVLGALKPADLENLYIALESAGLKRKLRLGDDA